MRVEWNNCFLCFNDLGGDRVRGGRKRKARGDEGKSELVLVLNYLLHTRFSRKGSNEVLETIKSLLDEFYLARTSGKRKGTAISICERCEVDVVLVAELHQQLEVIQMRMVEVLKVLRRKVVECCGMKVEDEPGNLLEHFENWLGTQNEEDVREQKKILEGIKGFRTEVVANDKTFLDIPRVFLDNLSTYRGHGGQSQSEVETLGQLVAADQIIKTEAPEIQDDDMMVFGSPPSPLFDHFSEMPTSSHTEPMQKKTKPPQKVKRQKKRTDAKDLNPEVKDESIARISSPVIKQKKCKATSNEKKSQNKKPVSAEFTLKSHVVRYNDKIRTRYVCRACPYFTSIIYVFENHLKIHDEELQQNPVEDKQLNLNDNSEAATATIINCQECKRTFRSQQYFQFHMAGHTGSHQIVCDTCQKKYSPFEIQEHIKSHSEKVFPCPNCSVCCSSREKYTDHLKHHTHSKCQHICDLCQETFNSRPNLMAHYDEIHPGIIPKLICGVDGCTKEFLCAEAMQNHRKGHESKKDYLCIHCGKILKSDGSYKAHVRLHENVNPFPCPHCPEAFRIKMNLNRHLILQHGAPKFKCQHCGKEYMDKSSLKIHLRLHTGTGVPCKECGKVFMTEKLLKRHMIAHSDERPAECEICGTRFKHHNTMRSHMTIHKGEKRFKCDYCDKAFFKHHNLKTHLKIHSGEKSYFCETCGKSFAQPAGLYMHKRRCSSI